MKKYFFFLLALVITVACTDSSSEGFSLSGEIEGVKVGSIYLQRLQDSVLVNVDSAVFDGKSTFKLKTELQGPEILYLHLDVKDGKEFNDRILFFAEDTTMQINSTLAKFDKNAVITGSKNQDIYSEFKKNNDELNKVYTAIIKRDMSLTSETRTQAITDSINTAYDKYLKKKVLYAINYAQLHKDKEVAPFILVAEASEANPLLLEGVYQKMPKKIQTTIYGKQLSELIERGKGNL
jgi:hypothetical protein